MGSLNRWEAWLEYLLPTPEARPPLEYKPPLKRQGKMAMQHDRRSDEVKALYDTDYYIASDPESLLQQVTR